MELPVWGDVVRLMRRFFPVTAWPVSLRRCFSVRRRRLVAGRAVSQAFSCPSDEFEPTDCRLCHPHEETPAAGRTGSSGSTAQRWRTRRGGRDEGAPPLRRDEDLGGGSRPVVATVEGGGGAETPLLYCALRVFYQL